MALFLRLGAAKYLFEMVSHHDSFLMIRACRKIRLVTKPHVPTSDIRFELPDSGTRSSIFERYAKQLSKEELKTLGEMSVHLSGRDICDICKNAERKWASKFIRKEVKTVVPSLDVYIESTKVRLTQMGDVNLRMEGDFVPGIGREQLE